MHDRVEQHKPEHEKVNEVSEKLSEIARDLKMDDDCQILERALEVTNQRWAKLHHEISEKLQHTGQMEHELAEFRECVDGLEKCSRDVIECVRGVYILDVPEGHVVDFKSVEVKKRVSKPEETKKDLVKIEVLCDFPLPVNYDKCS